MTKCTLHYLNPNISEKTTWHLSVPLLQAQFYCKKLVVANVVISFCWGETTREEGAGDGASGQWLHVGAGKARRMTSWSGMGRNENWIYSPWPSGRTIWQDMPIQGYNWKS